MTDEQFLAKAEARARAMPDGDTRILTVEEILSAAPKPDTDIVTVPEFGGSVKVKGLTRAEWHYVKARANATGKLNEATYEQELFLIGVVEPRFTAEQYKLLTHRKSIPTQTIIEAIIRLSGTGEEAVPEALAAFPGPGDGA
jgi:hypothetical protein